MFRTGNAMLLAGSVNSKKIFCQYWTSPQGAVACNMKLKPVVQLGQCKTLVKGQQLVKDFIRNNLLRRSQRVHRAALLRHGNLFCFKT